MQNAKCKIKKCREKRGVLPEGARHLFSLLDMELFGVNDRPQEGAEVLFVALSEAALGHDVGGIGGDVEIEGVLGFRDLLDGGVAVIAVVGALIRDGGLGKGLLVEFVIHHTVLIGTLADSALELYGGNDQAERDEYQEEGEHDDRGGIGEHHPIQNQQKTEQKQGKEDQTTQDRPQNGHNALDDPLMLAIEFHKRVVGESGVVFDFHIVSPFKRGYTI